MGRMGPMSVRLFHTFGGRRRLRPEWAVSAAALGALLLAALIVWIAREPGRPLVTAHELVYWAAFALVLAVLGYCETRRRAGKSVV